MWFRDALRSCFDAGVRFHAMSDDANSELVRALRENEIVPYFQPLIDLRNGGIVGFEVLARWLHRTGKIIYPAEFISVAESAGLIGLLSEHLLHQACVLAGQWSREVQLTLNISPVQLTDPAMPERLHLIAEGAGFPLNRLTFEITEGAIVRDYEIARRILGDLKSSGAQLALDDFGTGHSGLQHLQRLPFDALKLDAGFVRSLNSDRGTRKIVAAVMGLCQSLGLTAVAEGIEQEAQFEMLRCLGYSIGQGWLFGRPAPAPQAAAMLENAKWSPGRSVAHIAEQVALRLEALPMQCLWQLQAVYEGAPVALAFIDQECRYVAVNERLAEINGIPVAAFLGRAVREVVPYLADQVEPRIRKALAGEAIKDAQTFYRPSGSKRPRVCRSSYQPVRDWSGEIVGVSVAVVDIIEHETSSAALSISLPEFRKE